LVLRGIAGLNNTRPKGVFRRQHYETPVDETQSGAPL
jgi:hypothetical protein